MKALTKMKVKASLVMMSHLSDINDIPFSENERSHRINFIKFLLLKFNNTDTDIDPDAEYKLFKTAHPKL